MKTSAGAFAVSYPKDTEASLVRFLRFHGDAGRCASQVAGGEFPLLGRHCRAAAGKMHDVLGVTCWPVGRVRLMCQEEEYPGVLGPAPGATAAQPLRGHHTLRRPSGFLSVGEASGRRRAWECRLPALPAGSKSECWLVSRVTIKSVSVVLSKKKKRLCRHAFPTGNKLKEFDLSNC